MASEDPGIVALDRRAVQFSQRIVSRVQPADLDRPTPCGPWRLRDLLEHMIAQHYGFAAASRGEGGQPQAWQVRRREDPVAAYGPAAQHVVAAFAAPGVLERSFALPEISQDIQFPAAQAVSFHFVDYVAHGWDVARSIGVPFEIDGDLVAAALPVARGVPAGPARLRPGAAFGPVLPEPPGAAALDEVLVALGRSPAWPG